MNKRNTAILYMLIGAFAFNLMNIFINLSGNLPTPEKAFFRNLIAATFAFSIIRRKGLPLKLNGIQFKTIFLRTIFGTLGILANFYAIDHMGLADASILAKLSPFASIIISYFILKEKIKSFEIVAVIFAFIGMIFVVRPSSQLLSNPTALIAAFGGISSGFAYVFVRKAGLLKVPGYVIVFYFSILSSLLLTPLVIFNFKLFNFQQFLTLLATGACASIGQFMITICYRNAPTKEVSIYSYSQVIFGAISGYILFSQIPNVLSYIGYTIIILSSYLLYLYHKRENTLDSKAWMS